MSLFRKLYNRRQENSLENYFTNIVAHLFQCNQDLLLSWVSSLDHQPKLSQDTYTSIQVETQPHFGGPRPDMLIRMRAGSELDVILVESKIESGEHGEQLSGYAQILKDEFPQAHRRTLVYITKYYEPKDSASLLGDTAGLVEFFQVRWHDFYHLLKDQAADAMIREVISFMEEYGMAQSNQFMSQDVVAMTGLINLYSLMNASLSDDVLQKFGMIAKEKVSPNPELHHEFGHYMLTSKFRNDSIRWLAIGYNLGNSSAAAEVAAVLQVNPESREKMKFLPALQELVDGFHWTVRCWDGDPSIEEEGNWIDITFTKKLEDFLPEADNLNSIKKFFLDRMSEIEQVQNKYPRLPWNK